MSGNIKKSAKENEVPEKEKAPDFATIMSNINKLLIEYKVTARDILHIARELETNATISLVFANLYRNIKAQDKAERPKKQKG